jgi:hypothetical protein
MNINLQFRIVFQPKDPQLYGKRRFAVGAKSLHKYIGILNAHNCFVRALNSKTDKYTVKLRKYGRIDFYVK